MKRNDRPDQMRLDVESVLSIVLQHSRVRWVICAVLGCGIAFAYSGVTVHQSAREASVGVAALASGCIVMLMFRSRRRRWLRFRAGQCVVCDFELAEIGARCTDCGAEQPEVESFDAARMPVNTGLRRQWQHARSFLLAWCSGVVIWLASLASQLFPTAVVIPRLTPAFFYSCLIGGAVYFLQSNRHRRGLEAGVCRAAPGRVAIAVWAIAFIAMFGVEMFLAWPGRTEFMESATFHLVVRPLLILALIGAAIGAFVWWRRRRAAGTTMVPPRSHRQSLLSGDS